MMSSRFDEKVKKALPAQINVIAAPLPANSGSAKQYVGEEEFPRCNGGATTTALLDVLERMKGGNLTWAQVLDQMQQRFVETSSSSPDYVPQLSSSRLFKVHRRRFALGPRNGTRRAVLIGINYGNVLKTSHDDVQKMKQYLIKAQNFSPKNITVVADDNGKSHSPTKANILRVLQHLASECKSGDVAVLQFVGLGSQLRLSSSTTRKNSMDEPTWLPGDFQSNGHITEKHIYQHLFCRLASDVHLTCVIDCGTDICQLPYLYQVSSKSDENKKEMGREEAMFAVDVLLGAVVFGAVAGGAVAAAGAAGQTAGADDCGDCDCDCECNVT